MTPSTVHRYLATLAELGYLEQTKDRRYRLTLKAAGPGIAALDCLGLRKPAAPQLRTLRTRSRCTASMAILDRGEVLYVARALSHRPGQYEIDSSRRAGSRLPAYCTALGKLLLACLPEEEQHAALKPLKLESRTAHTITSKKVMRVELERIHERGIAVNDEELLAHLHAIAVPVRDAAGEVIAAVSISAHTDRVSHEELVHDLRPHLAMTADRISAALGYSGVGSQTVGGAE
jgi:IclR family transcriptional regulator, pca regulon regulatory protein